MKRIKLAVVSHALVQEICQKRWRILAEDYPVDVSLVVPSVWRSRWLRKEMIFRPRPVAEDHFKVMTLPTTTTRYWGKYLFYSRDLGLRTIQPDIIYVIQEEMLWIHQQVIFCRNRWSPPAKMMFFSMNALGVPQKRWDQRWRWEQVRKNYDAGLGHYPGCLQSLKTAGFDKPFFMQTQIGIDEGVYAPDEKDRAIMRKQLGLNDFFVIGYAGRLTKDKGLDVLLQALSDVGGEWKLLLVGDGNYRKEIECFFAERGWTDRLVLAGPVGQTEVARYLRAIDCFVLGSRTRSYWLDTFPNSLVQAMACGVAVIGSDSAAIPWIIRDAGCLVPEGDPHRLGLAINRYAEDTARRVLDAQKARQRAVRLAGMKSLSQTFYDILQQILTGQYRTDADDSEPVKAWI